jgi:hypothetical protein
MTAQEIKNALSSVQTEQEFDALVAEIEQGFYETSKELSSDGCGARHFAITRNDFFQISYKNFFAFNVLFFNPYTTGVYRPNW